MISVTAAAHGFRRTSRSMGTHLKAYGSGRVALGSIDEDTDTFEHNARYLADDNSPPVVAQQTTAAAIVDRNRFYTSLKKIVLKFLHILLRFMNAVCPLISLLVDVREWAEPKIVPKQRRKRQAQSSILGRLEDKLLLRVLRECDAQTILNLEATCSRFRQLIHKHANGLAKIQKDQIKLYFDEGEVIIFPVDERKVPARFAMPSIEHLAKRLRHLSTLSLFIRGLIPAETVPVLKRLSRYALSTSQIYFLWCEFDEDAGEALKDLFLSNVDNLSDIGFEVCRPPALISDALIAENLSRLVSLRIWHESSGRHYAISDQTLFRLADLYESEEGCPLEMLDIAAGSITVSGVCALVEAWYAQPRATSDLYVSLHNCGFTHADVIQQCHHVPIHFKHGVEKNGYRLTLNIT